MKIIWKGSIAFGLVNIPINLYAATESHALGFTLLHEKCHTPLKNHRFCEHCKKEVLWSDTVKGLEKTDGSYLILTQEMIKELRPEKSETIKIVEFVEEEKIADIYLNHHYVVAPGKKDSAAFALFMRALSNLKKVAIGRFVMRDKEYTCMLNPYENYLLLTTLHYTYEIKKVEALQFTQAVKFDPKEVKLAQELINKLSVKKFDMSKFKDTFAQEIKKLLAVKGKKKTKATKNTPKSTKKKATLKESLRQSIEVVQPVAYAKSRTKKRTIRAAKR